MTPDAVLSAVFGGATDLPSRLAHLQHGRKTRLSSHEAGAVWLGTLERLIRAGADAACVQHMLSQWLLLCPDHPRRDTLLNQLLNQVPLATRAVAAAELVFMVASCERYLDRARALQWALAQRGATVAVLVGDPTVRSPTHEGGLLRLPVPDHYEALPDKVLAGISALRTHFGQIAIMKLDDDCFLTDAFDLQRVSEHASLHAYSGVPVHEAAHAHIEIDRCWHVGKTSVPLGPYGRRFRGPYARGAAYLLGPRAVDMLATEWLCYPAEFAGEYYEDKMVGDFLRQRGVALRALREGELGVDFHRDERPVAASCA